MLARCLTRLAQMSRSFASGRVKGSRGTAPYLARQQRDGEAGWRTGQGKTGLLCQRAFRDGRGRYQAFLHDASGCFNVRETLTSLVQMRRNGTRRRHQAKDCGET